MNKSKEQISVLTPEQIKAYSVRRAIDFIADNIIAQSNLTLDQERTLNIQVSLAQFSLGVSSPVLDAEYKDLISKSNNLRKSSN